MFSTNISDLFHVSLHWGSVVRDSLKVSLLQNNLIPLTWLYSKAPIHDSSWDWSSFSHANFALRSSARFKTPTNAGTLDAFSHVILWAWLTVLPVVLQTGHPKWSQFHLFIHGLKNGSNCELCHWLSFLIWLLHWEKQLCHCPIKDRHTKKRSLLSSSQEDNNKRGAYRYLIWVTQLELVSLPTRWFSTLFGQ